MVYISKERRKKIKPGKIPSKQTAALNNAFQEYASILLSAAGNMSSEALVKNIGRLPWKEADRYLEDKWKDIAAESVEEGWAEGSKQSGLKRSFTLDNPYSKPWFKKHGAALVRDISKNTRAAIRSVIKDGMARNQTVDQIARNLRGYKDKTGKVHRGVIGLTDRDSLAVDKYHMRLLDQEISVDQAEKMRDKYAKKLLHNRGDNIAQTEIKTALGQGKLHSWDQAVDDGVLLSDHTYKRWFTSWDERTCPICIELHNVTVPLKEPFPGGLMSEPAHPRCHCVVNVVTIAPGSTRKLPKRPSKRTREAAVERNQEYVSEQQGKFEGKYKK